MNFLKKVPIPMSGLVLGLLSLGNLFKQFNFNFLSLIPPVFGFIILAILILKIFVTPKTTWEQLQNPMVLAVSPTFTMALMVATTYFSRLSWLAFLSSPVWHFAFCLQLLLMAYFIYRFIFKEKVTWSTIYPSWFILFVGLGIAPITGQEINPLLSEWALILSFVFYIFLLPFVLYRLFKIQGLTAGTKPLVAITCAPSSLLLTGYLTGYTVSNQTLLVLWLILAQGFYLLVLYNLTNIIPKTFYPTWAALTFPFVICATGLKNSLHYFTGFPLTILTTVAYLELIIAIVMVSLALAHYISFLFKLLTSKKQA